jgi:hypothetical protein
MGSKVDPRVLQCFDAGLDSIGKASMVVYGYLSKTHNLNREKIVDNPSMFLDALRTLFGQGAGILERMIMRELKQAFHLTLGDSLEEVLSLVKGKTTSPFGGVLSDSASTRLRLED